VAIQLHLIIEFQVTPLHLSQKLQIPQGLHQLPPNQKLQLYQEILKLLFS
jgi:hypothetical protein